MNIVIYDIEANGLLDTVTKIHCLCYCYLSDTNNIIKETDLEKIKEFFLREDIVRVGHNIIRYDEVAVAKVLGITPKGTLIDTLSVAWYLEPLRKKVGLEEYGEEFGIPKPQILDWENQSVEDYIYRCSEDVKINTRLWKKQYTHLLRIYEREELIFKFLEYLMFKTDCAREQEEIGIKVDIPYATEIAKKLEKDKEDKLVELKLAMPKCPIYKTKEYGRCIEVNGQIYEEGDIFFEMLQVGRKVLEKKVVKTIKGYSEPKPTSSVQLKKWLYSLGWIPENIKHVRDKKTEEVKLIPQIASKDAARNGTGEICDSIKRLYDKEPRLELIEGLSVLTHRISILNGKKGFLTTNRNSRVYPTTRGWANTLRFKHVNIVNLPGIDKKYGHEIRSCIIADEGNILCGCDLSGIEDNTKRHYIYKYDPKYVEEMNTPGFDPHLDIGILARMITKEESDFYKWYEAEKLKDKYWVPEPEDKKRFNLIKSKRNKTKIVNFSATYKVGAKALARNSGLSLREAQRVLEIYWKRNEAILKVEKDLRVKTVYSQMWQQNPVNGFWYSLRAEKDKFSTLNQGTAVYVFDTWLSYIRGAGLKIPFQYHDEWLKNVPLGEEDATERIVRDSMNKVNDSLKLNVKIGCSVQWGKNYAECH